MKTRKIKKAAQERSESFASEKEIQKLWRQALSAQKKSYSPYSKYPVGAALVSESGEVFEGCNVENASYGGTVCAERTAILKAVSQGVRKFKRLMVVVKAPHVAAPCALCLQSLAEFCDPSLEIWLGNTKKITTCFRFGELLPISFGPKDLLK